MGRRHGWCKGAGKVEARVVRRRGYGGGAGVVEARVT